MPKLELKLVSWINGRHAKLFNAIKYEFNTKSFRLIRTWGKFILMNSFNVFHFEDKKAEPLVFLRTLGLLSLRSSINFVSCPFLYELLEIRGHILLNLARICFSFK